MKIDFDDNFVEWKKVIILHKIDIFSTVGFGINLIRSDNAFNFSLSF